MELIGFIIAVIGFPLALWQTYRAEQAIRSANDANRRAKRFEAKLAENIEAMPDRVAQQIKTLIPAPAEESEQQSLKRELIAELGPYGMPHFISYADVNSDGSNELLIQYPFGAHASSLKIFGWHEYEFREISEITTDTPTGFWVEDTDSDGQLEIVTVSVDEDAGLPYVMGLRSRVVYKWNGSNFAVISTQPEYEQETLEARLREWQALT
jgi:hypothetical protein